MKHDSPAPQTVLFPPFSPVPIQPCYNMMVIGHHQICQLHICHSSCTNCKMNYRSEPQYLFSQISFRSPGTIEKFQELFKTLLRDHLVLCSQQSEIKCKELKKTSAIADEATSAVSTEKMTITFLKYWIFKKDICLSV